MPGRGPFQQGRALWGTGCARAETDSEGGARPEVGVSPRCSERNRGIARAGESSGEAGGDQEGTGCLPLWGPECRGPQFLRCPGIGQLSSRFRGDCAFSLALELINLTHRPRELGSYTSNCGHTRLGLTPVDAPRGQTRCCRQESSLEQKALSVPRSF